MFEEELLRALVCGSDDALDLFVDDVRRLFRIDVVLFEVAPEEDGVVARIGDGPEFVAHAPLRDHLARHLRDLLDVVGSARRDILDDDLFGDPAAQRHADEVVKLLNSVAVVVRFGTGERVACRHAAGDDGNFLHVVVLFTQFRQNGMTRFVVSGGLLVGFRHHAALLLRAHDDFVNSFIKLEVADELLPCTGSKDGCLVEEVGKVGSREAARHAGDGTEVDVGSEGLVPRMDFEDLLAALDVGEVDVDLSVETAGTEKGVVEDVGTVGRRHDDDPFVGIKAVHLDEDLVEGLFPLVVTTAEARSTLTAHGIDLIDEDDAGLVAFCKVEEITHTRGTDTDVHLDEVGAAHREEGNARFACNGLCEQRFTRSGRADEENALGDLRPEVGELLGAL